MVLVAPRHVESSGPKTEPMFPALAGGFLSTVLPGKFRSSLSWAYKPQAYDFYISTVPDTNFKTLMQLDKVPNVDLTSDVLRINLVSNYSKSAYES